MRIISKFHDYYDSVQGYGFDPTITYVRKTKELRINSENYKIHSLYNLSIRTNFYFSESGTIYFCGKQYKFIRIVDNVYEGKYKTFFNYESFAKFIETYNKNLKKIFYNKKNKYDKRAKEYFEVHNNFEENVKKHEKYNSPILVIFESTVKDNNVVINPRLKDYNFQTVFDPYSAYQEIDMFLSGVLQSPEKNIITIPDKYQKYKKGFDDMSFKPKMREKLEKIIKE